MSKPTVFLDIDHTILDMDLFKDKVSEIVDANYGSGSSNLLWEVYADVRQKKGFVDVEEIGMEFAKRVKSSDYASAIAAFLELEPKDFLYSDAEELIDYLSDKTHLVIFSHGHELFQGFKVRKLGLDKKAEKVIITPDIKHEAVSEEMFAGFEPPYVMIDDIYEVLAKAKKIRPDIVLVLAKYKREFKEQGGVVNLEAKSVKEIVSFLKTRFGN